jgi:hypothetical protein
MVFHSWSRLTSDYTDLDIMPFGMICERPRDEAFRFIAAILILPWLSVKGNKGLSIQVQNAECKVPEYVDGLMATAEPFECRMQSAEVRGPEKCMMQSAECRVRNGGGGRRLRRGESKLQAPTSKLQKSSKDQAPTMEPLTVATLG